MDEMELSELFEKFCWKWRGSNIELVKKICEWWPWSWILAKAFERVSLPVVWMGDALQLSKEDPAGDVRFFSSFDSGIERKCSHS